MHSITQTHCPADSLLRRMERPGILEHFYGSEISNEMDRQQKVKLLAIFKKEKDISE